MEEQGDTVKMRKKVNVLAIVFGAIAAVCAGVAVFFGINYFVSGAEDNCNEIMNCEDGANVGEGSSEEEAIVASGMADEYEEVYDFISGFATGVENDWGSDGTDKDFSFTVKPEGLHSYVPLRFSLSKLVKNSKTGLQNVETLKGEFLAAGFTEIGVLPFVGSAGPQMFGYEKAEDGMVCATYAEGDSYGNDFAVVSCAKKGWAWLTDEEYELISELETAYYEKTGEYPGAMNAFGAKVIDSEYEPYQRLRIGLGGGGADFYRVSPDAKWQYFAGGQAALPCSDYNTEDLKRAFLGVVCYEGNERSTVRL